MSAFIVFPWDLLITASSLHVSAGVMGEYEPKIEVQFPEVVPVAKSSTVKLECFALGKYVSLFVIKPHS